MKSYRHRIIDRAILQKIKASGGIVLRGVRACGKTTTALRHAASSVRLDKNPALIEAAEIAPETILSGSTPRLIDELCAA